MHIFVRFGKVIERMCIVHLCGDLGLKDHIGYVYRCVDFKLKDRVCLARLCYDLRNIRIARLLRVYLVICRFCLSYVVCAFVWQTGKYIDRIRLVYLCGDLRTVIS